MRSRAAGRFVLALARESGDDDISGMAAEMAYRFLLALVPLLLVLVTLLGFVGPLIGIDNVVASVLERAGPLLPAPVIEILGEMTRRMVEERSGGFFTLGLLGTLWGAASGVGTLLKGLNRAYDVDQARPLWRRQALGFAVALALPFLAVATLVVASAGGGLAVTLALALGLGVRAADVIDVVGLILVVIVFFLALSVVYHRLPNVRARYREALPGTVVTLAGFVILTQGFGIYLDRTSASVAAYTTFGTAFVFLLWLYFVSLVILVGAEVNALLSARGASGWRTPARRMGAPA